MSGCPSSERVILSIMIGDLTLESGILLLTLLSARKRYTGGYCLFYIENQEGERST